MSEVKKNNFIILSYYSIQKKILIPNDFTTLENEFIKNFNEDKQRSFDFYYLVEDEKKKLTNLMTDTDFEFAIKEITEKGNSILFIECKQGENEKKIETKENKAIAIKKPESGEENKEVENNKIIDGKFGIFQSVKAIKTAMENGSLKNIKQQDLDKIADSMGMKSEQLEEMFKDAYPDYRTGDVRWDWKVFGSGAASGGLIGATAGMAGGVVGSAIGIERRADRNKRINHLRRCKSEKSV